MPYTRCEKKKGKELDRVAGLTNTYVQNASRVGLGVLNLGNFRFRSLHIMAGTRREIIERERE